MKLLIPILYMLLSQFASAQEVECPLTIPEGGVEVKQAPKGWLAVSTSLARLNGAGMMRGHPREMGYLVPHTSKKGKEETRVVWQFDTGDEKWLWCTYGTMAVQLAKRMDDAATACTLTSTFERPGVIRKVTARCR